MKIGITGASGFVGSHLARAASAAGHEVAGFSRDPSRKIAGCSEVRSMAPGAALDVHGLDAIVNLAGESIMGIWTGKKKAALRDSRVSTTQQVVEAMRESPQRPRVLLNASAIGFYGATGETAADESSPPGTDFLAEVATAWEREALKAAELGIRVVLLRLGIVLGADGGAMKLMRPAFAAGLGGKLGSGRQWMSWIHIEDAAGLALFAIENAAATGPINATAPEPCRNSAFTTEFAAQLHRPAIMAVPAFALKLALGELAVHLVGSFRVVPERALAIGYQFKFPTLREAMAAIVAHKQVPKK